MLGFYVQGTTPHKITPIPGVHICCTRVSLSLRTKFTGEQSIRTKENNMFFNEFNLVILPLFALTVILCLNELKTDIIPDIYVFPATIYFLIIRIFIGPETWWHYPVIYVAVLVSLVLIAMGLTEFVTKNENIGGGCIKLVAVVAAALGFSLTFHFLAIFVSIILLAVIFGYLLDLHDVPSSIYILLALFLVTTFKQQVLSLLQI